MRKLITFLTDEYTGYKKEQFTMSVDEKCFDQALEIVENLKDENIRVHLSEIEEAFNENNIDFEWVNEESTIITL